MCCRSWIPCCKVSFAAAFYNIFTYTTGQRWRRKNFHVHTEADCGKLNNNRVCYPLIAAVARGGLTAPRGRHIVPTTCFLECIYQPQCLVFRLRILLSFLILAPRFCFSVFSLLTSVSPLFLPLIFDVFPPSDYFLSYHLCP